MFKISEIASNHRSVTLLLEGRLVNGSVEMLSSACNPVLESKRRLTLDFSGVTFIDGNGSDLVRSLIRRKVTVVNCSGFIAQQIKEPGENK